MEIIIYLLRTIYLLCITIDIALIIKRIIFKIKLDKNDIYYSGWIYWLSLFCATLYNFIFIMTDLVSNSWFEITKISSVILLVVFSALNPIFCLTMYIGTLKKLKIKQNLFVVYKLFGYEEIPFSSIDIKNSEYVFKNAKGNKIFPAWNIFNSTEYLILELNNKEKVKINLYPFIIEGNITLLMIVLVKTLKIKRIEK